MKEYPFVSYRWNRYSKSEMVERAKQFLQAMEMRRSIREFSSEPVPRELIEAAIKVASTAPSGANRQPWKFVAVGSSEIRRKIRVAAEAEEKVSYEQRMPDEWLEALAPLGTDWQKPFLETAPWLVVVFAEAHGVREDGSKRKHYYVQESVGIACGLFIAALHQMGLATLTHTPSPMGFLSEILNRPKHERPYILFPVGYPAEGAKVPVIEKKSLEQIAVWFD
jgi:iodotyrosine deiodinase